MAIERIDAFIRALDGTGRRELTQVQVEEVDWVLNQEGGAKISVDPLDADALRILLNESEIELWFDDNIRHFVVPRGCGGNTDRLTFECEGLLSWFHYAYFTDDVINNFATDQFNLAFNLVEWVQAQLNGDRRIASAAVPGSGIFRARPTMGGGASGDYPNVYDLLQELPRLYQGYDFDIVLFNDGRREFTPYYPSKGTRKPQYALEFDERGRKFVEGLEGYKEDGFQQGTDVYNTGGTITDTTTEPDTQLKIVGHYEDTTASGSPKYGRMTKVMSDGQIIDLGWLTDRAQEEEILRGQPVTTANIVVSENLLGLIETGDILPCRINYGRIKMNGDYKIINIKWRNGSRNLLLGVQPA